MQGNIWIYKPVGWVNPQGGSALPPSPPANVSASDGTSTASVTIGTSATTSFIDTTAVAGNLYFYGAAATGPGGTSAQSAQNSGFRRLP